MSLSGIQPLDSDAEKTIEQSAITVLVTDSIRLLSTPTSKFLVSLILDKPAAGLLVRLLPNDIVPKDFAKSQLKKQLDGLGATQLPVFYTHSVSDREALQPLVSHIESLLSSPESLKALEQTAKIHALQRASKARSESLLESRNALQSSLESLQRIEKETIERLVMLKEEFQSKDSAILQASCASVSDSLRESLGSLSVPKLWFKGDSVADEVASVLQNDALLDEGRSQVGLLTKIDMD